MKILQPSFLIFISLLVCPLGAQDTLLLFHPTAYNLETIQALHKKDLLRLDGYHVLGVYHPGENYDYGQSEAYIENREDKMFSLRAVGAELDPENIYLENEASASFRKLFKNSRGALFMGGPDIPPAAYGEAVHLLTSVSDPARHFFELSYIFHLLGGKQDATHLPWLEEDPDYLICGICLGMQSLNVATGGTLIQDIPTEVYKLWTAEEILDLPPDRMHRNYGDRIFSKCEGPTSYHFHRIQLEKKGILGRGISYRKKTAPLVLSSHHQAVEELGKGWIIAARSMDGNIIEAIQHSVYPRVFGVQFHPEKPGLFDPGIVHPVACQATINFQQEIANSDSYDFHVAFWRKLGKMLAGNRR